MLLWWTMSPPFIHLTLALVVFFIVVKCASAQPKQQGQKQVPSQQYTSQLSTAGQCSLVIQPGAKNNAHLASGGIIIMNDEPCIGFGPQTHSDKNSRRKKGCRNAAERLARVTHRPECQQIVHGQCLKAVVTGEGTSNSGGEAACHLLIKRPNGSFQFKILSDCVDGKLDSTYSAPPSNSVPDN